MNRMILSINPKYIDLIIKGEKKFEFRKFVCKKEIKTILLYATAPVSAIIGEVKIIDIIKHKPEEVWKLTKDFAGLTKEEFNLYYYDRKTAIAYELGNIKIYKKPKSLKDFNLDTAPRSFAYV